MRMVQSMGDRHILIVEDNTDDEQLILRALDRAGVAGRLAVVRDGQEACDYLFDDDGVLPDMILLDLKLPKVDGFEVLGRIRSSDRTRHLRVVVFTSSSEDGDVQRAYEDGASSFVQKPVDFDKFMETGQRIGSYWLAMNCSPVTLSCAI